MFATSGGGAAPVYGLVTSAGVCAPLVAGLVTGHVAESQLVALGTFYVGITAWQGPYGARARSMLTMVAVVTLFSWLGGLISGQPWLAVVVVPAVAALGAAIPRLGPMAALCTLVAALRPSTSPVLFNGLLETLGGLWICALQLVPWVAHRLRSLRACLAAAALSAAAVLDVLAALGPESSEWPSRHAQARAALRSARVAYGLYRSGGFENQQRPARIIDATGQVVDQAVALRSLLIDMEHRSPPQQWQAEYRAAITAVAARLRRLGEAIESDADLPAADGPVSLDRLARVSDQACRQPAGEAAPVAAALLQVRWVIDRMDATTDSVSQSLVHDRHLGGEPRTGGWAQFTEAVTTRSPRFRHAARLGTAMALTMVLAIGLHLPHPHWMILTVLFSLRDSYTDTVQMLLQQAAGTTVGAIVAAVALALAPERITLLVLIFISGALGFTLKPVNTTYWIMFGTPATMLLIDFTVSLNWTAALLRIALTLAGALLALVFARLLFPAGTRQMLAGRLARLLNTHAELARALAARPEHSGTPIRRADQNAAAAAAVLEAALTRLALQAAPPQEQITRLREAGKSAQRVRDHLNALAPLIASPAAGPIATSARQVADYLYQGADALLAHHTPDTDLRPGGGVESLGRYLPDPPDWRRAELGDAGHPAMTSRGSPNDLEGAREAVRALVADAERLRNLTQEAAAT